MIFYYFLDFFRILGQALQSVFGRVDVLPLGIDSALVTAVGWVRSLVIEIWPVQIILTCFIYYVGFRLVLLLLKLFLGHRAPSHV